MYLHSPKLATIYPSLYAQNDEYIKVVKVIKFSVSVLFVLLLLSQLVFLVFCLFFLPNSANDSTVLDPFNFTVQVFNASYSTPKLAPVWLI